MEIKITKLNEKCRIPSRAHYNDAGMDCYAMEDVTLPAMSYLDGKVATHPVMIPLGFNIEVPDGYMAVIKPRSSFNVKGIYTGIGTCDSGYRGEYKAVLVNPEIAKKTLIAASPMRQRMIEQFGKVHPSLKNRVDK